MESFLVSTSVVALAEIGDKTQLLSLILAARFRKPLPIVLGILVATLLNHALAGALGVWLSTLFTPETLNWIMGISFIAMGLWILVPDKLDEQDVAVPQKQMGVYFATLFAIFLAEMGDKTQFATIALAAQYHQVLMVVLGTTSMPVHQVLRLSRGAIIELDATEADEVKILANNLPIATGMVLVDRNRIAVEVKQMLPRSPDRR